MIIWLAVNC